MSCDPTKVINKMYCFNETPLFLAAMFGELKIIKMLVKFDVDLDALAGYHNETALAVAATFGYKDVVEYLTEMGASINIEDGYGRTALYWAIWFHEEYIADYLKDKRAIV